MANFTPNYNLKKPLGSEYFDVEDQNGNMDLIDTALKETADSIALEETDLTNFKRKLRMGAIS